MSDNQNHNGRVVWPPAPTGYEPSPSTHVTPPWRSVLGLSRLFLWLTCAPIVVDVIGAIQILWPQGVYTLPASWSIFTFLQLAAGASIIIFFIWTYRVVLNVGALGVEKISASPGWAVGYYFIPILALYRPYQVMQEAWRASDPTRDFHSGSEDWRGKSSGSIVAWWWACWLLYAAVTCVLILARTTHLVGGVWLEPMTEASYFVAIVKNGVAIGFVLSLTARQEIAYRRLIASSSP